ncbi:MAG: ASPIC/UnbV domain-containing protein, partial [Anaerolineae bacterium]
WGAAWSDYDSDGDLDLAGRGLWRNRATDQTENHWLQVKATGCGGSNRDAIGATVAVMAGADGAVQRREIVGARGTGSQDSPIQHFGLGAAATADQVVVGFPSGQGQTFTAVAADQRLTVTEVGAYIIPSSWAPAAGDEVALRADTCGQAATVSWDLDDDGNFDDAQGGAVTTSFPSPGRYEVGVQVTREGLSGIRHAVLDVVRRALYLPRTYRQ